MPLVGDVELTHVELREYLGTTAQWAGIDRLQYTEGPERGVDVLRFRTGSGLDFDVLPGRGMDIAGAWYQGLPLAWMSGTGIRSASHFEPAGLGWLRNFYGGLVTTCGLTNVGSPCADPEHETLYAGIGTEDGEVVKLGLHGRVNNTPARQVSYAIPEHSGRLAMWATGAVRESTVFGECLDMRRSISTSAGAAYFLLDDELRNRGWDPVPYMMLYHINLGWPVVSPDSELITSGTEVEARDAVAAPGLPDCRRFCAPQPSYPEQVFYHRLIPNDDGDVHAAIINRRLRGGFGVGIKYRAAELPEFVQWKSMKRGTYVCGLEPANCRVGGRAEERTAGRLRYLQHGQQVDYTLAIRVLDGPEACAAFEAEARR